VLRRACDGALAEHHSNVVCSCMETCMGTGYGAAARYAAARIAKQTWETFEHHWRGARAERREACEQSLTTRGERDTFQ
jgi:hypothetical protein